METDPIKKELLDAARGYFTRFGYSRVSTNEIAASAGRSKKTLYKHFANKEELLKEVLADVNDEVESEIMEALAGDAPFAEMAYTILLRIGVHESSITGVLIADLQEKSPQLYNQIQSERDQMLMTLLQSVFKQGQDQGLVRSDINMEQIFHMYLAGIKHVVDSQSVMDNAGQPTKPFEDLARVVIDGLLLK